MEYDARERWEGRAGEGEGTWIGRDCYGRARKILAKHQRGESSGCWIEALSGSRATVSIWPLIYEWLTNPTDYVS